MTDTARLFVLSLLSLLAGSAFGLVGVLTGDQWVDLVGWVLGLHAAGSGVGAVAKPTGEWLSARAGEIARGAKS